MQTLTVNRLDNTKSKLIDFYSMVLKSSIWFLFLNKKLDIFYLIRNKNGRRKYARFWRLKQCNSWHEIFLYIINIQWYPYLCLNPGPVVFCKHISVLCDRSCLQSVDKNLCEISTDIFTLPSLDCPRNMLNCGFFIICSVPFLKSLNLWLLNYTPTRVALVLYLVINCTPPPQTENLLIPDCFLLLETFCHIVNIQNSN